MEVTSETMAMLAKEGVSMEHGKEIEKITSYIGKHRLNELFNVRSSFITLTVCQELLANVLLKKPEDPKQAVLDYLRTLKHVNYKQSDPHNTNIYEMEEKFLNEDDFEAIFESMDVLGTGAVPKAYMEHALGQVGVKNAKEILRTRYAKIIEDEDHVNKVSFMFILS